MSRTTRGTIPRRRGVTLASLALAAAIVPVVSRDRPAVAQPEPTPPCVAAPADPFRVGSVVWDASLKSVGGYIGAQEEAAACLGIDLTVIDGQASPDIQAAAVRRFVEADMDVIIVMAGVPDALLAAVQEAVETGTPVIATVTPLAAEAGTLTFVGYDARDIGRAAGEMIVAAVGEQGRVGVIAAEEGSWTAAVAAGLVEASAAHPGVELVERQVRERDEAQLRAVVDEWLDAYPPGELAAILGPDALETVAQVADRGRGDVRVFAGYYSDEVDAAITDGLLRGAILEDLRDVGRASIEDAHRWLAGEREALPAPEHLLPPTIVTLENVGEYPAWDVRPAATLAPEPSTSPPARPLATGDLATRARRMCLQARPADLYAVRSPVAPARGARGLDTAHLVLVEYRDLGGTRRREPRIRADSVYDVRWIPPFDWESPGDIDVLACLALRATRRATWEDLSSHRRYTVDDTDAILWMVDAVDGGLVGRAWLRREPRPRQMAPGAPVALVSMERIRVGRRGPGILPPAQDTIVRDVRRFLGQ